MDEIALKLTPDGKLWLYRNQTPIGAVKKVNVSNYPFSKHTINFELSGSNEDIMLSYIPEE